jgi:hypothetical protein
VSDFFSTTPPPPQEEPQRYRTPEWMSAPNGTLPGVVALELVLARNDRVAVCVTRLAAYPTGFEFELVTMTAGGGEEDLDPLLFGPHRRRRGGSAVPEDDLLRIGVQFADGAKATNVGGFHHGGQGPPAGPVMQSGGGGGGGGSWRQNEWVWPLPPPGPLTFVCEWPAAGIELTRREIDAGLLREAASRAQVIFAEEDLPDAPGFSAGSTIIG